MAELDRAGLAAVFAADTELDVRARLSAELGCQLHELADALLIHLRKRIRFVYLLIVVVVEELARVVTREPERHLCEVVRAKREEFSFFRDLIGGQRRARHLDHCPDKVFDLHAFFANNLFAGLHDDILHVFELFDFADQRNHDLRLNFNALLLRHLNGRFHDGTGLHLGDFRIRDGQTAASVPEHRVELVQVGDREPQLFHRNDHFLGKFFDILFLCGQEFVQRRIQQTDGNRQLAHRLIYALEVFLLHGQQLIQRTHALIDCFGNDHFAHSRNSVLIKEHMLRAAKTDAFRAKTDGLLGVVGCVRVGSHLKRSHFISPFHDGAEIAGQLGFERCNLFAVNNARGTVERNVIAFLVDLAAHCHRLGAFGNHDFAAARYAAGAHASGHHSRVRGHAASGRQYALGCVHTFDILR